MTGSFDDALKLGRLYWGALICLAALLLGYLLAADSTKLILGSLALGWLCTLPYHAPLSIALAVSTFSSALILPYFPGRPFMWEFAALLGWSGMLVTIFMRRFASGAGTQVRRQKWLFLGAAGYCLILVITMYYRGFGLRIFGGTQMGGRFYFQQLACSIFPLLFVFCRPREGTLVRLFHLQCILTLSYLISDFVFSVAPKEFYFLLQFFELPSDAVGFRMKAENFGIRRFQSLNFVSVGIIAYLLSRFELKTFLTRKGILLVPFTLVILAMGLFSGHRILMVILIPTVFFCGYCQRFFNFKHYAITVAGLILFLIPIYVFAPVLPLAVQRAVSYLPGIDTQEQAKDDAGATLETRRILRKIGMDMAPEYFWMGRGFGQSAQGDFSFEWDPTAIQFHINQGKFYNGVIGLLVNTGVFGTVFMLLFLSSGTLLAFRIMRSLRATGCADDFQRVCCVLAGLWMANVIAFLFLHGDSEYAMKTFSLQAGILLACDYHLRQRALVQAGDA